MSYPKIIKEAALEKMFHTDLSLRQRSAAGRSPVRCNALFGSAL